jgi:glycosyltransferase involved in cell wall biosynthesis
MRMNEKRSADDELRDEIDRLRHENQRLRIDLAEERAHSAARRDGVLVVAKHLLERMRSARRARGHTRSDADGALARAPIPPAPYVVRQLHHANPTRPRVLHVIANFHLGGSARLVVDLVERLGHAYEQSVVSWDLPETPAYTGISVRHHAAHDIDAARRVLREERPDLLHAHYLGHHRDKYGPRDWEWYRHWFASAEQLGVPVIENINIPTEPYVSAAVACYVHVSDYVRHRFGRRDGRHVTIYPGSDLERFTRPAGAALPNDCLGMVYRFAGDKVDEHAIEPFIDAVRMRPATRALIVGGGRHLEAYQRRVADSGLQDSFTFTGFVAYDALPALYQQMSIFVAPVHRESFGQVTPFAMAMRMPVVGYDVGAIPEILADSSLLAPAGDSHRLAAIAAALLDDPARRAAIGEANRARAERLFSVEAMVTAYESLYRELAPARGARVAP